MGCGQSKINLYPRRNKAGSKSNGKKAAAAEAKDADEEEAGGAAAVPCEASVPPPPHAPRPPPPSALGTATEISASQQDFFKMLDDKIEKGRDYDSSSETEIQIENERVACLIQHWESASQTSSQANASPPPTPSRRRQSSQDRQSVSSAKHLPQAPEKPRSPDVRRCLKGQAQSPGSPPARRLHSHPYQTSQEYIEDQKATSDRSSSPKRGQQANNWKPVAKSPQYGKPAQNPCEDQRCYSPSLLSQREIHQSYGVSQDYLDTARETSQITYNPTFQSHSPAHSAGKATGVPVVPQPYIAQIITYPMSQQAVAYQNAAQKYISQPQPPAYQQQPGPSGVPRYPGRAQIGPQLPQIGTPLGQQLGQQVVPQMGPQIAAQMGPQIAAQMGPQLGAQITGQMGTQIGPQMVPPGQPSIYYIAPTTMMPQSPAQEQALTPKQQTALHLQQYVAMKQAQQAMGYQRIPGGQTVHDFGQYSPSPNESPGNYNRKLYERSDESYSLNFMTVGRQPAGQKAVLQAQRQISPGLVQLQQSMGQPGGSIQQFNQLRSQSIFQNRPGCTASLGRNQSLSQKDMITAERYGISNPTQNNVSIRSNMCQNLNIVTQKTIGQIVPVGGQDLVIYQNIADAATTDGRSRSFDGSSPSLNVADGAVKVGQGSDGKPGREHFFAGGDPGATAPEQKAAAKPHLGANIVGRQMYYSQVVSAAEQRTSGVNFVGNSGESVVKKPGESAVRTGRLAGQTKTTVETTPGEYL